MDYNIPVRAASAGNLTGDVTIDDIDMSPMVHPLYLHVIVPSVSSGDTLVVKADFEDGNDNTLQQTHSKTISAAGHYVVPLFCDDPALTDLSVIFDCTADSTAAMSFGAVKAWISPSRTS